MWEVPRYRIRRYLRHLRKVRTEGGAAQKPTFHIKRTRAELVVIEGIATPKNVVPACIVLNDLSPVGLLLFSAHPFFPGQKVGLTIESPKLFYAKCTITSCKSFSLARHVLADETFPYRVAMEFDFQSETEKLAIRRYCLEIYSRYLYGELHQAKAA